MGQNNYYKYKDEGEMALDYAAAVNAEIKDLFADGADIAQIDEPYIFDEILRTLYRLLLRIARGGMSSGSSPGRRHCDVVD